MIIDEGDYLEHYGTLRKSGRYPWGSGETQNQRNKMFLDYIADLKRQGLNDAEIGKGLGPGNEISSTKLRELQTIAKNEQKMAEYAFVRRLKDKQMSNGAIGARMNPPRNESSVRAILAAGEKEDFAILTNVSNMLKERVAEDKYIDVGSGNEAWVGISATKLATAVRMLQEEGYELHPLPIVQLGTGLKTRSKVLCPPGTPQREVFLNQDKIRLITASTTDHGRTFTKAIQDPIKIDPSRVAVRYGPDGGAKTDGVIYVRPGVDDISLGKSRYAQVRIAVGDDHYLKGMAMYKDDLPKGVDLLFNTVKDDTGNKFDAMKRHDDDPDKPMMTSIRRQITKMDSNGNPKVTSAMNIIYEEGKWENWTDALASQVLSKQDRTLAKAQLDRTYKNKKDDFDAILKMTNPTVRKHLLKEFSDSADSSAVHLEAAALPRQGWHAILPIDSMPPGQIYAPRYRNGEVVALIRYPHGGTFEIPELIVNNNHREAKKLLSRGGEPVRDAVGIHHSVAERLSGADFDGDTVLVIPNESRRLKITPALEGLKGFDPRREYKGYPGMKIMSNTPAEMGAISNLITDMTIRRASTSDITRAIKHSMVVIDAEKHGLNYKLSAEVNGIKDLKAKYMINPDGGHGASTLISRAGARTYVLDRKPRTAALGGPIDKVTGELKYEPTNIVNYKTGKLKTKKFDRLAVTSDAHELSSGTPMERLYADHSNRLKSMANQARLVMINTPRLHRESSATKIYADDVKSLEAKLAIAIRNRPLERQAQTLGTSLARAVRAENPNMTYETYTKIKFQALDEARARIGAKKKKIEITESEWNAIQAGALSDSKLSAILDQADMDIVRKLATPRPVTLMTSANTRRAEQMLKRGASRAEVAEALGVSLSTLDRTMESPEEE